MAVIEKSDLISDLAIAAPLVLNENFLMLDGTLDKLLVKTREYQSALGGNTSTKKLAVDTQQLAEYNKQLVSIQKQLLTAAAKSNSEYIGYAKTLKEVKDATKTKTELGDRDAKSVNKQNSSIAQLGKALAVNRAAYGKLETAQERNSKEGISLLKVIQQQDAEFKGLRESMGQSQDNVGNYEGALKKLKGELKSSKDELIGIAATLGTDSEEFAQAAEKAGKLKDELNDIQDAVKNTEASPFENLGKSLGDVGAKLKSADFTGAAQSANQFAQASKAITLKEAVSGLKNLGSTITSVGKAILSNPLFLLAAVLIGLTILVVKFYDKIKPLKLIFDLVGGAIEYVIKSLKNLSDFMGLSSFAAEEAADKIIKAYDKARQALVDYYETSITVANAAGASTYLLELKKQEAIAETTRVQVEALDSLKKKTLTAFDLMAIAVKNYLGLDTSGDYTNKLSDENQKLYEDLKKQSKDANTQIVAIEIAKFVELRGLDNQYARDRKNNLQDLNKFQLEKAIELKQKIADSNTTGEAERNNAAKAAANFRNTLATMEAQYQKGLLQDQFKELRQNKETELSLIGDNEIRKNEIIERFRKLEVNLQANIADEVKLINEQKNSSIIASELQLSNDLSKISIFNLEQHRNTADQISNNESTSFEKRLEALSTATQLEYSILEEQFTARKALNLETLISEEEYNNKLLSNAQNYTDKYLKILLDQSNAKFTKKGQTESIDNNEELAALDESYQKKEIGTSKYLLGRKRITEQSNSDIIGNDIQAYEEQISLLESFNIDATDVRKSLSDARLAIEEKEAADTLAFRQKLNDDLQALGQASFDSAVAIGQNLFDAEDMKRQERLDSLTKTQEEELRLAGDNETAKNEIKNKFALEAEKIRLSQAASDRKRAIFEKATAATQIAINTALAISKTAGQFGFPAAIPFIAIAAAIGAVQLAAVLTKPIPSFAEGTDNFKGGLARYGEAGPEKVTLPSGSSFIAMKETVSNLPAGTKIDSYKDTIKGLALGGLRPSDSTNGNSSDMRELRGDVKKLTNVIKNKHEMNINITKRGIEVMTAQSLSKTFHLKNTFE